MRLLPTRRPGRGSARRGTVLTVAALMLGGLLAAGVASAATTSTPSSQQFTACLNPDAGQILNAEIGTSPRMPCVDHQVQITWSQTGPVGPAGPAGPQGPQGPPGTNVAAGQSCPSGQFVTGFDSSGNITCSAPAPACPANSTLTATVTSSPTATLEEWPGGQQTLTLSGHTNCTVTVANPSHTPISNIGGTAGTTGWVIVSKTGFTSASGVVNLPTCNSFLAVASVTGGNYPTCSNASTVLESGPSTATFTVSAS